MSELEKVYRAQRASHPYLPAVHAMRYARWHTSAPVIELDWTTERTTGADLAASFEREGFNVSARWVLDNDAEPRVRETDDAASGIRNPRATFHHLDPEGRPWFSSRAESCRAHPWVTFESGESVDNLAEWYHDHEGASRSVARDIARETLKKDAEDALWDYGRSQYGCTVTVRRHGVELGSASLWGIEESDDYTEAMLYRAEIISELLPEALDEARATLAKLCES